MTDKKRLAQWLANDDEEPKRRSDSDYWGLAERLLARGITIPPKPEPELTPTQMVRALLEKGWEIVLIGNDTYFESSQFPDLNPCSLRFAYRKAFPKPERIEVDAQFCPRCRQVSNADEGVSYCLHDPPVELVRGKAVFEVPI